MKITIYHGSNHVIKNPEYGLGKKYNDYGIGFYCTRDKEMAQEWAVTENSDGYTNIYELETKDLKILDLTNSDYNILNWLCILLQNREFKITNSLAKSSKEYILKNFKINYDNYDVIIGYRADDSYFSYAFDFINGAISLEQLKKAMKLGLLGTQIVLKSKKAFSKIKYKGNVRALRKDYLERKNERDNNARRDYKNKVMNEFDKDSLYILTIMREEMKNNDPRIR